MKIYYDNIFWKWLNDKKLEVTFAFCIIDVRLIGILIRKTFDFRSWLFYLGMKLYKDRYITCSRFEHQSVNQF